MRPFLERLKSRKLIMALLAALVAGLKAYYPDIPEAAIYTAAGCLMGYVAIEGGVDAAGQITKWLAGKKEASPVE